jgi:hypothetical protein
LPWYAPIPDGPTPPNGSLFVAKWNSRVVDHHAARGHLFDHAFTDALGLGEQIRRQGLGPRVDEIDCLVEVLDGDDRQDRSEDLVGHQRLGRVGIDDDRRLDADRRRVRAAADRDAPLVAAQRAVSRSKWRWLTIALAARVVGLEGRDGVLDLVDELSRIFASAIT